MTDYKNLMTSEEFDPNVADNKPLRDNKKAGGNSANLSNQNNNHYKSELNQNRKINSNPVQAQNKPVQNQANQNQQNPKVNIQQNANSSVTVQAHNKPQNQNRQIKQVASKSIRQQINNDIRKIDFEALNTQDDADIQTQSMSPVKKNNKLSNNLKVMFLGGLGEIGKNMTVLEYGNDIIVIDCGVMFPGVEMLGIDLVVPDVTYLQENQSKLRGFLITHGHEDHIGSIPYVMADVHAPIFASKMTCGLIKRKLEEHKKIQCKLNAVKPKQKIKLGCFEIEFIHVNHAIPGAFALAIKTPVGMVVHSGDYKIDLTPVYDEPFDFHSFAELGKNNVLLYMADSTNAEREGYSVSERVVEYTIDRLFADNKDRRIIVAAFASNVDRMQDVMNIAEKYKRKIVLTGRSMINVTDVATEIGEMKINKANIIDVEKIKNFKDSELCIMSTGSQGEPNSALPRMADGEFKGIEISDNDTVIFSSSPIPGNEKSVNNVMNKLIMRGAKVIYSQLEQVHASGHAYKEEQKIMLNLIKPKYFIPVHGEQRHLLAQRETAVSVGMDRHNVLIPMLGMQVEVNKNLLKCMGSVPFGSKLVDGAGIGEMESNVLKERKQLSEEGLCIVILNVNTTKCELNSRPEIVSRGFTYIGEAVTWLEDAKNAIIDSIDNSLIKSRDYMTIKLNLRKALTNYLNKKLKRKPMIIPIIIESN